jgi:hypothetical protein
MEASIRLYVTGPVGWVDMSKLSDMLNNLVGGIPRNEIVVVCAAFGGVNVLSKLWAIKEGYNFEYRVYLNNSEEDVISTCSHLVIFARVDDDKMVMLAKKSKENGQSVRLLRIN